MPLTDEQLAARKRQLIDEERKNAPGWWYLSFASETEFLGACIVQGQGPATAIDRSQRLGINPGGEVMSFQVPAGKQPPPGSTDRLLSKADLERLGLGGKSIGEMTPEEQALFDAGEDPFHRKPRKDTLT